ncbi:MAG: FAD-dependent monooxygenase [Gammaproteobacteria bacterium]|nr:FAD-dependent monooxygenase [Gammaproteobacteria bacterium]
MNSAVRLDYDVVIVGGGLVGMSLALALAPYPLKIALLESRVDKARVFCERSTGFLKPLVLSESSRRFFESVGVWKELKPYAVPIESIHVSEEGHWGVARFKAEHQKLPAFGYVIESALLEQKLKERLEAEAKSITFFCPIENLECEPQDNILLRITHAGIVKELRARCVVGADGTYSTVRKLMNIPVIRQDFPEAALVGILTVGKPKPYTAFERFLKRGVLAVLPFSDNRFAFVYTRPKEEITHWMSVSDVVFLEHIQVQLGYRLGRIQAVQRSATYPLAHVLAEKWRVSNAVLLGNAAHTLHPIGAQGFNLALRDLALLAEYLVRDYQKEGTLTLQWMSDYVSERQNAQKQVVRWIDFLTRSFSVRLPGSGSLRSLALFGIDSFLFLKAPLLRFASGLSDIRPRLLRGLSS